jgi:CHAD domain-containing protein
MATVTALPGALVQHRGFTHWMQRVLKELDNLRQSPDKDAVHDLRVAIRRCRSVAAVMREVDPDPAWHDLRRLPKKLFRKLGELRDTQIMRQWVKEHGAENDKLRGVLEEMFQAQEPKLTDEAVQLAEKFDEKGWKRLGRKLRKRMTLVPTGSLAAQCLAVERLNEAKGLHTRALRAEKAETWHGLRIGLKKFRYTVESLLPEQYAIWSGKLKQVQDLLGEVHDLDVLRAIIKQKASDEDELRAEWERTIDRERTARLQEYREVAVGKNSMWQEWAAALPQHERLQLAALARLRATARAMDAHPRRAACVSRLSVALFDALAHVHAAPVFGDRDMRRTLRATARLSGLRVKGAKGARQKVARRFLHELPVPPSWTQRQWELLAWAVRYHRGGEPKLNTNAFARLHEDQQMNVRALAGLVRLARGLRKCGVEESAEFPAEKTSAAVILTVSGLADSAENAARLAAAKHLLETYLGKALILRSAPPIEKVTGLPSRHEHLHIAAASD